MSKIGISEKPKIVDLTKKEITAETLTEARITCTIEEKVQKSFHFSTELRWFLKFLKILTDCVQFCCRICICIIFCIDIQPARWCSVTARTVYVGW